MDSYLFMSKPVLMALKWQLAVILIAALLFAWPAGIHGAVSAILGGLINLLAALLFAWVASINGAKSPGNTLRALFRAEASKIAFIVLALWWVLTTYQQMDKAGFFITFIVTVLVSQMTFFVRES